MYNYNKLKGKIKEILGSQDKFAEMLGISNASVSAKLNGKVPFSTTEIDMSINILKIPKRDVYFYFFNKEVEKNSTISEQKIKFQHRTKIEE